MSFGYAAAAVLDRPETDGGSPESGHEDTRFELISTCGPGVVDLTCASDRPTWGRIRPPGAPSSP